MRVFKKPEKEIWVYNLSDRDRTLYDLNITIPAMKAMNLLRDKIITEPQIIESVKSGDLFKKKRWLKLGGPPNIIPKQILKVSQLPREVPHKGGVSVAPEQFDMEFLENQIQDDAKYIEQLLAQEESEQLWTPKKKE